MALYEAALVNALAQHVIPRLPDVTQIPEATWDGWEHIFTELQVDRGNEQQVKETIERCQTMLGSLLQAALMSGQQQQPGVELGTVPPMDAQVAPVPDMAQQQAVVASTAPIPASQGTDGQVTASQLQLTQIVGSAGEQQVLLNQPKAHIIARARMPRGERLEIWYQLAFEGFSEAEAEWFPAHRIRSEYPHGDELIANFERGLDQSGRPDVELPAGVAPGGADAQVAEPAASAMPMMSEAGAVTSETAGMQPAMAGIGQLAESAAAAQQVDAAAAGHKRGREDEAVDEVDPSKRQRADEAGTVTAVDQHMVPTGSAAVVDPAAVAEAAAATSAGMAAQLGAGGQLFAMAGADGQPMLQVVPLQMPDAANLGQLAAGMDVSQLTQLTGLDPQTLQALTLQGMQVGNMQQLVFQMPGAGGQPMLAAGLQLAMPHQLQMPAGHHPGREHVIAHIKEGLKMLMHSSEELQRKKRQQLRRNELNQRRALLLPDGSAAPGALPTTAAGTPAPPPVRPMNMLQHIQSMPMAEKRAMLISALRRAIPVMMQTCQAIPNFGMHRMPTHAELEAAGFGSDSADAMIQYQQLLAAQGQASMGGMQLIAVPLQGGMQTLMQMPLSAEQLQQMGSAVTLDANGQLQALQAGLPGVQMLDPTALASMGMLTPEQLQQLGLQGGDASVAAAALDPAALQAAAAALGMPGQELGQHGVTADGGVIDPAALQAAAVAVTQPLAYDPSTSAALQAAAAAAASAAPPSDPAAIHQQDAAAAAAGGAIGGHEGGVPAEVAQEAAAAAGAMEAAAVAAAGDASAPGAEDAAAAAAAPKPREEEAILAAISLTSLSRMSGPEDQADGAAASADPHAVTDAAAVAAVSSAAVTDNITAAVMQSSAPTAAPSAAPEQAAIDLAAAAVPVSAADINMAAYLADPAALAALQHQQLLHLPGVDGFVQLPAHLAGMQHLLDQNQSLLDPSLSTQDFTAAAHTAAAADGAAPA